MRIKDVIEKLSQYDSNTEIVINVDDHFVCPKIERTIVPYKHDYNGISYKDEAIVFSNN